MWFFDSRLSINNFSWALSYFKTDGMSHFWIFHEGGGGEVHIRNKNYHKLIVPTRKIKRKEHKARYV